MSHDTSSTDKEHAQYQGLHVDVGALGYVSSEMCRLTSEAVDSENAEAFEGTLCRCIYHLILSKIHQKSVLMTKKHLQDRMMRCLWRKGGELPSRMLRRKKLNFVDLSVFKTFQHVQYRSVFSK